MLICWVIVVVGAVFRVEAAVLVVGAGVGVGMGAGVGEVVTAGVTVVVLRLYLVALGCGVVVAVAFVRPGILQILGPALVVYGLVIGVAFPLSSFCLSWLVPRLAVTGLPEAVVKPLGVDLAALLLLLLFRVLVGRWGW